MKTFKYALVISISLPFFLSQSFAYETSPSYISTLEKKANNGDISAQIGLGYLYKNGQYVPKNHQEAFKWYYKSAGQGFSKGIYALAQLYEKGQGTSQNYQKAI